MRLKCIKLAGFKSFVDPTTVEFPSNLCAVVGPNGCGKSNIIDAVRWVMGESSAKNLRGESMTDVIFNGSGGRKPVGQASIELVFDNSDGSVGGEYARFSEISIKRKVTRDGQNLYFLNGEKCRRRDITDIFLGTGLGPRSYAIIEQGMISRLIEAKPEELRIFIEEAAGISKYKERRKETESRMRRTAENMERLTDIREELERQLQHLQRQAASAEKYTAYRQEERLCRAQLHAMQWRELDKSILQYGEEIGRFELELEAALTRQTSFDAEMDKLFTRQGDVRDSCDKVQARYYALGAEKARCEEAIKGRKERQRQLADDLAITRENCIQAEMHMREDRQKLDLWQEELEMISPELALVSETEEGSHQLLLQCEEEMQAWQLSWDEFSSTASHSSQKAQIQQSRIQHIEKVLERMGERIRRFDEELSALSAGPVEQEINDLVEQIAEVDMQIGDDQEKLDELQVRIEQKRQASAVHSQRLDDLKTGLQIKRGRYSALEALQQAALSASSDKVSEWLVRNGLAGSALLAEEFRVTSGWEKAVETVLSGQLQSVCVEAVDPLVEAFSQLNEGSLQLVERGSSLPAASGKAVALLEKVSNGERLYGLLAGILVAETLADALALRPQLAPHESVVTRDGIWLGPNWLRRLEENSAQAGLFQRKEEMEQLQVQIGSLEEEQKSYEENQERNTRELNAAERERDDLQKQYKLMSQKQAELTSLLSGKKAKVSQILGRKEEIQREIQESHGQYRHEQEGLAEARGILQEAIGEMENDSGRRESLIRQREEVRNRLETAKQRARSDRDRSHQLAMKEQSLRTQIESVTFSLERVRKQVEQLVERRSVLERDLAEHSGPEEQLQLELEALLDKSLVVEEELAQARKLVEGVGHEMREADRQRSLVLQEIERHRSNLERSRLAAQTLKVQRENLHRQLVDDEFEVAKVLEELPPQACESEWSAELERIAQRIARLGPINLAAIDEYKVASERKNYLDAQNTDLEEALATLEGAIRKIDRETRMRFKDTFDQINASVQELFPKVFGGGRAYLEMTGEDLLDTGIAIMAQPPGKRNSTIHLLSGGEKALTAIALVFSIFRLNPAPFCMLDEVDAPLDDANVGRYANMVKEMSSQVQFIYITHNKIAMEMAQQLMGVTMYEPGVSRMVTVDVDEAVELADS